MTNPVFYNLETIEYSSCVKLQQQTIAMLKQTSSSAVFFLEHDPVITIGKNTDTSDLQEGVQQNLIIKSTRGGRTTAHMPGQLVVYPLLSLHAFKLTPKKYVAILEKCVMELLTGHGLDAEIDPQNPGVWVGKDKVAAIGVQFTNHYTMHGIAINVENDLSLFKSFVPCGISGRGVTSLQKLGINTDIAKIKQQFAQILAKELDFAFESFSELKNLQKHLAETRI